MRRLRTLKIATPGSCASQQAAIHRTLPVAALLFVSCGSQGLPSETTPVENPDSVSTASISPSLDNRTNNGGITTSPFSIKRSRISDQEVISIEPAFLTDPLPATPGNRASEETAQPTDDVDLVAPDLPVDLEKDEVRSQ